jgi:hypothetical protein
MLWLGKNDPMGTDKRDGNHRHSDAAEREPRFRITERAHCRGERRKGQSESGRRGDGEEGEWEEQISLHASVTRPRSPVTP